MGQIRIGTAGWTDKTLIDSGWYPQDVDSPEKRLRYYADQFPLVEVDSTYYALPAEQTATAWKDRTPAGFTFNIKAFSLFTQHPTPVKAMPADLREAAGKSGKDRVYLKDMDPAVADQAWDRFFAALSPLEEAGKLGAILLQFPPWFPISRANKQYIVACAERAAPRRVCIEFRNRTWMTPDNQKETLEFLSSHQLPYVCVDEPQGYPSSIPPVLAATSDLAVVRMHGHSDKWDSKSIQEKFGYRYTEKEMAEWSGNVQRLAEDATQTHVVFNNCYRDYAQVNARELADLLGERLPSRRVRDDDRPPARSSRVQVGPVRGRRLGAVPGVPAAGPPRGRRRPSVRARPVRGPGQAAVRREAHAALSSRRPGLHGHIRCLLHRARRGIRRKQAPGLPAGRGRGLARRHPSFPLGEVR